MKLACITGASSGIGKEFAYLLSDLEYDLILVGRNSAALHEIPADYCAYYALCKMFTGKLTIVPTFTMKAGVFGSRFLPRQVLAFMTGHQQKKKTDNI